MQYGVCGRYKKVENVSIVFEDDVALYAGTRIFDSGWVVHFDEIVDIYIRQVYGGGLGVLLEHPFKTKVFFIILFCVTVCQWRKASSLSIRL